MSAVLSGPNKPFEKKEDLQNEVNKYCDDPDSYESAEYGPINKWDVSKITDFSRLFYNKTDCNPEIGEWDVSSATNMEWMFSGAGTLRNNSFNQDIGDWDVGKV
eukprot:CAMPEP_0116842884 /NCGR_PEP_ID=MMETSP0418-20121206/11768_1 /TAXON_ID=1158023 /ORGANISM="Astrosyne radiata, Strain 13vi08-1A" /LENGTH=103 /DNA_ID=CAMNT_0004473551 /DNA_START=103 /DNA_END=411 /DNA_ORIENTATION=+